MSWLSFVVSFIVFGALTALLLSFRNRIRKCESAIEDLEEHIAALERNKYWDLSDGILKGMPDVTQGTSVSFVGMSTKDWSENSAKPKSGGWQG